MNDESLKFEVKALGNPETQAVIPLSEQSRRMQEMYRSYGQQFAGMSEMFKDELTLVSNSENVLIKKLDTASDDEKTLLADHIYDLAMLCHRPLSPEQMTHFVERSNKIMERL